MKCKYCNQEITKDEDGYWDVDYGKYKSAICNDSGDLKFKDIIFHQPDLFQEYLKEVNEMH